MDMIEERNISFLDNTLRKAEGSIQGQPHTLVLRKEHKRYVISLYSEDIRIKTKSFVLHNRADRNFTKLMTLHNFSEVEEYSKIVPKNMDEALDSIKEKNKK